jgi:hypothetical protein
MAKGGSGQGQASGPALAVVLAGVLLQTLCLRANGQSLLGIGHDPLAFVSVNPVTGALTQIGSLPPDAVVARAGAVDPAAHRVYVGYETQSANALATFDTQTGALLTSSPLSFRLDVLVFEGTTSTFFGVGHDPLAFVSVNPVTGALTRIGSLPPDAVVARAGAVDPAAHRVYVGYQTQSANALATFDTQTGALLASASISFRLDLLVFEGSTPIPGDANCNGRFDGDDVTATVTAVFDPIARALCDADCNQDGAVTAADMTCVVELLAGPQ